MRTTLRPPIFGPLLLGLMLLFGQAGASHDEEVILSSVLARAHDRAAEDVLRRMMGPAERRRFDESGGMDQLRRLVRELGITTVVTCTQDSGEAQPLDLSLYRCQVLCQRGSYVARVLLSPGDALVVPEPRPGRIERLWLASPVLDRGPWPWFPRRSEPIWLGLLWAAGLLLAGRSALRLTGAVFGFPDFKRFWSQESEHRPVRPVRARSRPVGRAESSRALTPPSGGPSRVAGSPLRDQRKSLSSVHAWPRARGNHIQPAGDTGDREAGSPLVLRAKQESVMVLRVLSALALGGVLLWSFCRLGPVPLWGVAGLVLGALGLGLLTIGLVLAALADHLQPAGPSVGPGAIWGAASLLLCGLVIGQSSTLFDLSALLLLRRHQVSYRVPLAQAAGPAYVRQGTGPLLDLVYQHGDGRSCHGPLPESCRSYGQEVVAPADGVVEYAEDRFADQAPPEREREHPSGNCIILRHGAEFTLLSHLQRGSITVRPGQAVRAGEPIARIGNSGDSDEPHLEMELWTEMQPLPGLRPYTYPGVIGSADLSTRLLLFLTHYRVHAIWGTTWVKTGIPERGQRLSPATP